MKRVTILMTAVVLLGIGLLVMAHGSAVAQEDEKSTGSAQKDKILQEKVQQEKKEGAVREDVQKPDPELAKKIEKLIGRLGDEEFGVREAAYNELREIGEPARTWLKKALDSKDPEVRWRASRLLFVLDEEKVRSSGQRGRHSLHWPQDAEMEERDRLRLFDDDVSRHLNDLFNELFHEDFEPFFFRFNDDEIFNIDELIEEFKRDTGKLSIQLGGSTTQYLFQRQEGDTSVSLDMNVAADGSVEGRVTRKDKEGKEETSTYTADNLDEFKKNYPEVVEEFQLDGFRVSVVVPDRPDSQRRGLGLRLDRAPFGFAKKIQRKSLGVYPEDMSAALRAHLNLDDGVGIVVAETVPDSFAKKVGIQALDVIVSIKGKEIGSAEDIRSVMSAVDENETVVVELFRKGKRLKLEGKYSSK
jgi:hypothetical protein